MTIKDILNKIACALGFHDFEYEYHPLTLNDGKTIYFTTKHCKRCGRK